MITATMRYGSTEKSEAAAGAAGTTNITNVSANANTLAPGSSATVSAVLSANSLAFTFGIPEGDEGQEGPEGPPGPTGNGIASITKTGTVGLVDTYTITYTNGTTTTFTVTNGQDGSGSGDMLKSTYDIDNDGYVDAVEDQEDPGNGIEFSLDANGKGQYRAVGASTWIPFLSGGGGPTYTRLWTNPSPSSNFSAQTVNLSESLENYDAVRIVWDRWYNGGVTASNWETNLNAIAYIYDLRNKEQITDTAQHVQMGAISNESTYVYGRRCYFPSTSKFDAIVFANGMRLNNANTSSSALIPVLIDGVKW